MDENPRRLTPGGEPAVGQAESDTGRSGTIMLWVNWVLALLTVPVAVNVAAFVLGTAISTPDYSAQHPDRSPSEFTLYAMLFCAPIIAVVVIVLSFFTARRRWGIVVPLVGLVLLAADFITLGVMAYGPPPLMRR